MATIEGISTNGLYVDFYFRWNGSKRRTLVDLSIPQVLELKATMEKCLGMSLEERVRRDLEGARTGIDLDKERGDQDEPTAEHEGREAC